MRPPRLLLACLLALAAPAYAVAGEADPLKAFLRTQFGDQIDHCEELANPTWYETARVDLNGDGRSEVLVYLEGVGWCGSGGCSLYVLQRSGSHFRIRSEIGLVQERIGVLATRRHGWRDLAVEVHGGGILPGYMAAVPFDGRAYAENPTGPPAWKVDAARVKRLPFSPAKRLFPPEPRPPSLQNAPDGSVRIVGDRVEVSLPEQPNECWTWVNLPPPDEDTRPLAFWAEEERRAEDGTPLQVWVYQATGSGAVSLEFALVPRELFLRDKWRAAAAKIWRANIAIPAR
jgi:hypothetical protein